MKLLMVSINEVLPWILGSSVLTGLITFLGTRRKTNADAGLSDANSAKLLVDTATELTRQMAEQNKKTQEELQSVYSELEQAKQTITDLQMRVEERTKAHNSCMDQVIQLQRQIDEMTAPKRGREPNEGHR